MKEKRDLIIEQAEELFLRYGIRSLTMDDLARQLGISKKTLYQHFNDKAELVRTVLISHLERDRQEISRIAEQNSNAIGELFQVIGYVSSQLGKMNPSIHFDLEKYYPEAWKSFKEHKNTFIYQSLVKNTEKGIRSGLYRDDINVAIICKTYVSRIDIIFDAEVFPPDQFHFPQVYSEIVRYHIRGIATEKGLKLLEEKIKEANK